MTLQKDLNKWVIISLSATIALVISLFIVRIIWQRLLVNIMDINVKNKKQIRYILLGFIIFLLFFCFGGWAVIHFIIPSYSPIPSNLIGITGLVISVMCMGALLWYIKHIKKIALTLFLLVLILNTYIFFDTEINLPKGPNVILISIDTLRADHLGCYGYNRKTSPVIDSFAKSNILFEHCYVQDDLTLPSHMSILTSLYPITHEVNGNNSLDLSKITLAEVLKNKGYSTLGFVRSIIWMDAKYGFNQGFDRYIVKDYNFKSPELNAEFQNAFISKYLKKYTNKNIFLFIHYYDVHSDFKQLPYDSPFPYNNMFYPDYNGDFNGGFGDTLASKYLIHVNHYRIKIKKDDLKYIVSLYDSGIAYIDKCIGDLFRMLKTMGLYKNSLIILTADHGEEFQEHGLMLHGDNLFYDETVHVPLIVKLPGQNNKPRKISNLIESIDIMPFILDYLGIEEKPPMEGRSFADLIKDNMEWKQNIFGFGSHGEAFLKNGRWKLVNDNILRKKGFRLFDISQDPMEKKDVKNSHPEIAERLRNELFRKYKKSQRTMIQDKMVLTEKEKEKLKSLGYVK
ncbi:MAG: sulfatase [Candidatus Hodarchaeota archaeon]